MMACCPRQYLQGSDSGETPGVFVGFSHLGWERSGPTLVSIRGAHKFSLAPCCLDERVTKWYQNVWFHCQVFFPYAENRVFRKCYLFERSEFLIDTSQKKSLRVCTRAVCTCARVQ